MNPLDRIGEVFALDLMNPNCSSRSSKDGPHYFVKFETTKEAHDNFMAARDLGGMVIEAHAVVVALNGNYRASEGRTGPDAGRATTEAPGAGGAADPIAPGKSVPNELARKLHVDGYFRNPHLWEAMEKAGIYTQATHKTRIESLPCMFNTDSLRVPGLPVHGILVHKSHFPCQGDIILHHCKGADVPAAGEGAHPQKPPHWYGVPLCSMAHHQNWAHASVGATREDKRKLIEHAIALTAGQMKKAMKKWLEIESLRDITPELLKDFEAAIGL